MVVNIICAYAPRVGCIENEKETFWEHNNGSRAECKNHRYTGISIARTDGESVIVRGDLN